MSALVHMCLAGHNQLAASRIFEEGSLEGKNCTQVQRVTAKKMWPSGAVLTAGAQFKFCVLLR